MDYKTKVFTHLPKWNIRWSVQLPAWSVCLWAVHMFAGVCKPPPQHPHSSVTPGRAEKKRRPIEEREFMNPRCRCVCCSALIAWLCTDERAVSQPLGRVKILTGWGSGCEIHSPFCSAPFMEAGSFIVACWNPSEETSQIPPNSREENVKGMPRLVCSDQPSLDAKGY